MYCSHCTHSSLGPLILQLFRRTSQTRASFDELPPPQSDTFKEDVSATTICASFIWNAFLEYIFLFPHSFLKFGLNEL
jgi:hypothetical protein